MESSGYFNFIDDIIVYGNSVKQYDVNRQVLKSRLKSNDVELNEEKCHYAVNELEFHGYELSPNGIIKSIINCRFAQLSMSNVCRRSLRLIETGLFCGIKISSEPDNYN